VVSFSVTPANGAGNIIPAGTTYSWLLLQRVELLVGRRNKPATISGPLTNPTNVVQTATYTVIPSANGCAGLPFDVVVSVNQNLTLTQLQALPLCWNIEYSNRFYRKCPWHDL
jgi:hypothetical protein